MKSQYPYEKNICFNWKKNHDTHYTNTRVLWLTKKAALITPREQLITRYPTHKYRKYTYTKKILIPYTPHTHIFFSCLQPIISFYKYICMCIRTVCAFPQNLIHKCRDAFGAIAWIPFANMHTVSPFYLPKEVIRFPY